MLRVLTISAFCMLLISCKVVTNQGHSYSNKISNYFGNSEIKNSGCEVKIISNFGSNVMIYQRKLNAKRLVSIVENLDWEIDNSITLTKENGDWMGFFGNIQNDGLYLNFSEFDQKFAADQPTFSIEEIILSLLSFAANDSRFKKQYSFLETN